MRQADVKDRTSIVLNAPIPAELSDWGELQPVQLAEALADADIAASIRGMAATGKVRVDADLMARFSGLEIIANFGVGYDRIDIDAARARGITVTNTPDVLTEELADFALGLLIATVRRLPQADRFVRDGFWSKGAFPLSASLRGRTIGILGLGRIGQAIAERCAAMKLDVIYHSRSPRRHLPYRYVPTALELAEAADVLVVVVPGGADTDGLVDAKMLAALGPQGVLINIARGSVVDQAALIAALRDGTILAAGLDVFLDEPVVPPELLALDNVVLLPHIGSATRTTRNAMAALLVANLRSWFSGEGALTPVS
jgi:lactate dehydrogenase-like 2-hydroxyacid dehydrogenase